MSDIVEKCKIALLALSDWAVTYAPDMCNPDTVEQAKARILEHGTLAYIASAIDQLHAAILALSEAEKREKVARKKALEEAAVVADSAIAEFTSDAKAWASEKMPAAASQAKAQAKAAEIVASSILALQSEER